MYACVTILWIVIYSDVQSTHLSTLVLFPKPEVLDSIIYLLILFVTYSFCPTRSFLSFSYLFFSDLNFSMTFKEIISSSHISFSPVPRFFPGSRSLKCTIVLLIIRWFHFHNIYNKKIELIINFNNTLWIPSMVLSVSFDK